MRVRLRDELGADPGEELRGVHEAVLHQDDALPPASARRAPGHARAPCPPNSPTTPRGSPAAPTNSPGSTPYSRPTREHGVPNTVVISAIGGAAGIGKTALAVHWAHQVRDRFPDGQLYVNLHGFDHDRQPLEPGEALELLLRSLGLAASEIPPHHEAQGRVFRTLLAGRRMLVLLDNAASAEQVRPLLPSSPTCCVLVTSRNRLGDLVARDGAHALPLDLLQPDEARALLSRALGADRVAADERAVDELIGLCGSLPLALRVAAARLAGDPGLRTADLVAEMTEGNRLEALESDGDANSPLRTAFWVSYRVLAPGARRLFRLLGLFPGAEFTAEAAAALLDAAAAAGPPPARRTVRGASDRTRDGGPLPVPRSPPRVRAGVCAGGGDGAGPGRRPGTAPDLVPERHSCRRGTGLFPELPAGLRPGDRPGLPSATEARDSGWMRNGRICWPSSTMPPATVPAPSPGTWPPHCSATSGSICHGRRGRPPRRRHWTPPRPKATCSARQRCTPAWRRSRWDRGHVREAMEHADTRTGHQPGARLGGRARRRASATEASRCWSMARLHRAYDDFSIGLRIFREAGNRYFEGFGLGRPRYDLPGSGTAAGGRRPSRTGRRP